MRILITGGNGFLGSSIVRKALQEGHEVLVFSINSNNIQDIISQITYHSASSSDLVNLKEDIKSFSPDIVVHCGWSGGSSYKDTTSLSQIEDNVEPSTDFIKILSTLPKKPKFVGFGSFAEYGDHATTISENATAIPLNLYGSAKLMFKELSERLCNECNMDWLWIRPCYVYGPHDVSSRLIPSLIQKFMKDETVVLDECTSVIDYIYIDDFTDQVYKLMTECYVGVYNICSGTGYSVKSVVEYIQSLLGSNSEVHYDSSLNRTTIPTIVRGDPTKTIKHTGITPKVDLHKGISNVVDYYKTRII